MAREQIAALALAVLGTMGCGRIGFLAHLPDGSTASSDGAPGDGPSPDVRPSDARVLDGSGLDGDVDAAIPPGCACGEGCILALGDGFSCAVSRIDAALFCWGDNAIGQLGIGSTDSELVPRPVLHLSAWVTVGVGTTHACAIDSLGALYCWGANSQGQLGVGDLVARDSPTRVTLLGSAASVDGGGTHTCVRLVDSQVWCWGANQEGQLGVGDRTGRPSPIFVRMARFVATGFRHTCTEDFCWGRGDDGALGGGDLADAPFPEMAASSFALPTAGFSGSCGIDAGGSTLCWGDNGLGQLGLGAATQALVPSEIGLMGDSVSLGGTHGCASSSGVAYCWGAGGSGEIGDGMRLQRRSPTRVAIGPVSAGPIAGSNHTCAVDAAGTIHCWGSNDTGQLGVGDRVDRELPAAVCLRPTP